MLALATGCVVNSESTVPPGDRVTVEKVDAIANRLPPDIADGGNPVFDLRLADDHRGRGLAAPILHALTDLVFRRWPSVHRFEGQTRDDNVAMRAAFRRAGWVHEGCYRDAWPVDGAAPRSSVV